MMVHTFMQTLMKCKVIMRFGLAPLALAFLYMTIQMRSTFLKILRLGQQNATMWTLPMQAIYPPTLSICLPL